ncbi:MAG: PAS domain S-box protein, partial [Deltaproteobacteria bacterium]|nr:PAS domain S-box protein [Deltaproteobacteria bacterium]
ICSPDFNFYRFVHPDDRKFFKQREKARITRKSIPSQFIFKILTKEGKTKHFEMNTVLLPGEEIKVFGTVKDISDRILSEKKVKFEHQQLLSILEGIDEPIYVSDPKTYEILFVNRALKKIFGNFSGKICYQIFQNRDSPCPFCTNKYIFGENIGKPYIWEFQNPISKHFYKCIDKAIRWPTGQMVRCELAIDINEQKTAQKALESSEKRYRDIIEKAGIAIIIDDQEGNCNYANKWYAKIFGYDLKEMMSRSIQSLVHPDDIERVMKYHKNRLEGKKVPSRYEFKGIRKDGTIIHLEVAGIVLKEKGKSIGTRSYLWDISDRKRAEEETQETMKKLRKTLNGTIDAITLTVELKDPYTSGHQRRVADLARTIATEMGIPKDQIDGIRSAGVMHDLGKILVPSDILSKPSKLSEAEFSLIKTHPQAAYNILKEIEFPWPVAQIIYQHHERMDGSGYPLGLCGDDILLEARILAVADVVEAMASHRPYRPALGIEKALEEISKNKGKLYDSAVGDACLRVFREKGYTFKSGLLKK